MWDTVVAISINCSRHSLFLPLSPLIHEVLEECRGSGLFPSDRLSQGWHWRPFLSSVYFSVPVFHLLAAGTCIWGNTLRGQSNLEFLQLGEQRTSDIRTSFHMLRPTSCPEKLPPKSQQNALSSNTYFWSTYWNHHFLLPSPSSSWIFCRFLSRR